MERWDGVEGEWEQARASHKSPLSWVELWLCQGVCLQCVPEWILRCEEVRQPLSGYACCRWPQEMCFP